MFTFWFCIHECVTNRLGILYWGSVSVLGTLHYLSYCPIIHVCLPSLSFLLPIFKMVFHDIINTSLCEIQNHVISLQIVNPHNKLWQLSSHFQSKHLYTCSSAISNHIFVHMHIIFFFCFKHCSILNNNTKFKLINLSTFSWHNRDLRFSIMNAAWFPTLSDFSFPLEVFLVFHYFQFPI
jgi:hypothetical protein